MLRKIWIKCPHCEERSWHSLPFIEGQIKVMKMERAKSAAFDLHNKRGPFYDKWLAAMEQRGEVFRCKDCVDCEDHADEGVECVYSVEYKKVNPGSFACGDFLQDA